MHKTVLGHFHPVDVRVGARKVAGLVCQILFEPHSVKATDLCLFQRISVATCTLCNQCHLAPRRTKLNKASVAPTQVSMLSFDMSIVAPRIDRVGMNLEEKVLFKSDGIGAVA